MLSTLPYKLSILPGKKEGISGSMISGCNIGITKNIAEDKKEKAFEVVKYVASREYQKKVFKNKLCLTPINEFLKDEEICKNGLCDIAKNIQFTGEPKFILNGPKDYGKRYQKYIYQFLYKNKTIDDTVKQVVDIENFYYVSLNTKNSYIGLICFIYLSVVSILMILSLLFLFINNFQPFFIFLSDDFWIITVLGSILMLWVPFISYGQIEKLNCHLKPLLMSIGYTLNIYPIIHKLITQFPEKNKLFIWIINHKYIFLLLNILIDILINGISLINPYNPKSVLIEDGENYKMCDFKRGFGIIILLIYKFLIIQFLLFLIFVEWNISATIYDIKFIVSALYIDILSIIFLYIFYIFEIKNYIFYFLIQTTISSIISISNYMFIYGFRLFFAFIRKQNIKIQFINNINEHFINNDAQFLTKNSTNGNVTFSYKSYRSYINNSMEEDEEKEKLASPSNQQPKQNKFISRMIEYHYSKE